MWVNTLGHLLLLAADGEKLDQPNAAAVHNHVMQLRLDADRVREELRRRIGTTRSHLAMVNCFKLRCEWHHRKRMSDVSKDDTLPGG